MTRNRSKVIRDKIDLANPPYLPDSMQKRTLGLLIAVFSFTLMCDSSASADTAAEIMKKFIGTWEVDECVNQGVEVDDDELEGSTTVITRDTITTFDRDKKETYKAKYKLNTATKPIQIDMTATMGGREMKVMGIVEFEWLDLDGEDEFKLAYSLTPGQRPKTFESPKGSKIIVLEMEQEDD